MSLLDVILSRRSIRQFGCDPVSRAELENMVDAGRLAPSAANRQPLEFILVDDKDLKNQIFPCLNWAAYIAPEGDPKKGQEPVAYIVVLVNTEVSAENFERDVGAAVENMILAAWEKKIGSCWLISIERKPLHRILGVPDTHRIDSVLAFGYPAESPVVEELEGSVQYWKDAGGRLHVPKRRLKDVMRLNGF